MSSTETHSADQPKKLTLGIIFLTIFIDLVGFSIIFPLFPFILEYYLEKEGGSGLLHWILENLDTLSAAIGGGDRFTPVLFGGVLGSLYATLQFFFAPLWGSISDRHGRRPILLLTTGGMVLSYVLWVFAGSFGLLIAARMIGGAMSGNLSVATAAVADVTDESNRSKGMGIVGVAFGLGFVIGPALGGICAQWNPLEANPGWGSLGVNPFSFVALVATLLSILNFVWIKFRFVESLSEESKGVARQARGAIARLLSPHKPEIRKTNFVYLVYILAFSGMEFTLTFLGVERFGYDHGDLAMMMIYVGFVLILTQGGLVRRMAPKMGEKLTATAGLGLVAIGLFFLSSASSTRQLYIGLTFMAIGAGLCSPTLTSLVSLYADDAEQGRALGTFRAIGSLGRAVGPILASIVFWWFGSDKLYLCGTLIVVIAFVLASRLPQPQKAR